MPRRCGAVCSRAPEHASTVWQSARFSLILYTRYSSMVSSRWFRANFNTLLLVDQHGMMHIVKKGSVGADAQI